MLARAPDVTVRPFLGGLSPYGPSTVAPVPITEEAPDAR
jgi:hypothetical protein